MKERGVGSVGVWLIGSRAPVDPSTEKAAIESCPRLEA